MLAGLLQGRTAATGRIKACGAHQEARIHAQCIGDGHEDTDAEIRLGCFDALQERQVNAGLFGQLLLCQSSQCALSSDVGGNIP
jgi:hypothetical protein